MNKKISLKTLRCKRCEHVWVPRKPVVYLCPKCKSPRWNEEK
jgi:Zn finger protein HypA/HybF involved in hydrogenase expression